MNTGYLFRFVPAFVDSQLNVECVCTHRSTAFFLIDVDFIIYTVRYHLRQGDFVRADFSRIISSQTKINTPSANYSKHLIHFLLFILI